MLLRRYAAPLLFKYANAYMQHVRIDAILCNPLAGIQHIRAVCTHTRDHFALVDMMM